MPEVMPGQTNRERVTAFTGKGTCGESCHGNYINLLGFAFENFDAMGQVRTMDNGKTIDTTGDYPFVDGTQSFTGAAALLALLASGAAAPDLQRQPGGVRPGARRRRKGSRS